MRFRPRSARLWLIRRLHRYACTGTCSFCEAWKIEA